jgi:hypothetical protein
MSDATYFERLMAAVQQVARHANLPGKQEAVGLCLGDIDDLAVAGRITDEQADVLRELLLGPALNAV